jgi:phage I-like protein
MDTPTPSNSGDDPDFMARLRAMLRLPQTAMEDEIADAIAKALDMRPDPEKFVPIEALQSVMEDRTQMATAQAQGRAETKVAQAIAQGHITPAMKDWATALCTQNEASFDAFIAKSPAAFSHIVTTTHTEGTPPAYEAAVAVERKDAAASVCRQLGLEVTALD